MTGPINPFSGITDEDIERIVRDMPPFTERQLEQMEAEAELMAMTTPKQFTLLMLERVKAHLQGRRQEQL